MVDLAQEAFLAANFELAAEVLEREIAEEGLTQERALGRADALAMQGNFHAAFEAYHLAFKMGKVAHERLNHLVTALVRVFSAKTGVKVQAEEGAAKAADFLRDVVMCVVCQGLLFEPVTIPCGHTFCKRCIEKDPTKTCPRCRLRFTEAEFPDCQVFKPTVILCNIFDKWWPDEVKAIRLKWEGNDLFSKKDFSKATEKYTEALNLVPGDPILHSNRSHAYSSNHEWSLALKDALLVCQLRPDWPKGHYRKGMALIGMDRQEEAMSCFLQCLTLDPDVRPAQAELEKLLHNLLSPTSELPPLHLGNKLSAPPPQPTPTPSLIHSLAAASLNEASSEESPMVTDQMGGSSMERRGLDEPGPSRAANVHMRSVTECSDEERMEEEESSSDSELEMGRGKGRRKTHSFSDGRLKACASEPVLMEQGCEMDFRKRANSASLPHNSPSESGGAKEAGKLKEPTPDLIDSEDFECSLCMRLFYNPVTTPCGHSFCRDCLLRCLDHDNKCPLCKFCLKTYLAERRDKVTDTIDKIIKHFLGKDHVKRQAIQDEEVAELARLTEQMPIFVCTVAYPTVPCPLHIFEPRYRLMLRRCLETGTRQFGMCIYSPDGGYMEHGTVLEIRDVSFMPDGRSVVDTVGKSRFKVLDRGMRDGYNIAKVEPMEDVRVEGEDKAALERLNAAVYQEATSWVQSLPGNTIDRILQHFGNMPDCEADPQANPDGPSWTWWLLAILPVDQRIQYTILVMNSLKDRLEALRRILSCIRGRQ
ncbi:LON peptidase N-terminal domain and RING finger protein 1-like [Branchiostoma floridae]|uniref:LON peptidase N-terminal domain and RING finger protein 1-like n=2 Tax=Branchiostoma floridae TaxID=7739 RepID=A0A9J7LGK1_BRAFL|nr:LON peptidase N-terminal domain and RING finger protein 1-like [Branchiostoma floridae]